MRMVAIELVENINVWAVVVAGIGTFVLGGLWYSPALFEGAMMRANGYGDEEAEALRASLVPARFAAAIGAYLAMAAAFAVLAALAGVRGVADGLLLGLVLWIGFVAATGLTVTLFSLRSLTAWTIDAGFQLTFLLATGAVVGAWR